MSSMKVFSVCLLVLAILFLDVGLGENNGRGKALGLTKCKGTGKPIDGGWSDWSQYSECDVTCGEGTKTRTRQCNNPAPIHCGDDCVGDNSTTVSCSAGSCGPEVWLGFTIDFCSVDQTTVITSECLDSLKEVFISNEAIESFRDGIPMVINNEYGFCPGLDVSSSYEAEPISDSPTCVRMKWIVDSDMDDLMLSCMAELDAGLQPSYTAAFDRSLGRGEFDFAQTDTCPAVSGVEGSVQYFSGLKEPELK